MDFIPLPDIVLPVLGRPGEVEWAGADVDVLVELGQPADVALQVLPLVPVEPSPDLLRKEKKIEHEFSNF